MKASYKYVKRWYLEMSNKPAPVEIVFPDKISIDFFVGNTDEYRKLNLMIGGDLGWVDRQIMSDEKLEEILKNPGTKIYVLYIERQPAGFAELELMSNNEIEMHYFGLEPGSRSKGLGKPFLQWIIAKAWKFNPEKFKLNTCEIDHPGALPMYLKAGFSIAKECIEKQAIILEQP